MLDIHILNLRFRKKIHASRQPITRERPDLNVSLAHYWLRLAQCAVSSLRLSLACFVFYGHQGARAAP